jgi:gliding motility-associated-like protein
MKRILLLLCVCFLLGKTASAVHIKGGWLRYEYIGAENDSTSNYKITVYVFKDCAFIGMGPMPPGIGIYDAVTNIEEKRVSPIAFTLMGKFEKDKAYGYPACISTKPDVCYEIFVYTTTISVRNNKNGYIISSQDATRVSGLINLVQTSSVFGGITFTTYIPGIINAVDYHQNSSPDFFFRDTTVICYNTKFTYEYKATDADGDKLTYTFDNALDGVSVMAKPPYTAMSYRNGFSGKEPLGSKVSIDSLTGIISGTAPSQTGEYVIAVYVHEWRNGVKINSTKKELQIRVSNCTLTAAELKQVYLNCNNYTVTLENESLSPNINSYVWDFGVDNTNTDRSTAARPSFTYADTGTFNVKLIVSTATGCKDSTTAQVKIYPGFQPLFVSEGTCITSPVQFKDSSLVKYGSITEWKWDFGDNTTTNDIATLPTAFYKYPAPVSATVMLSITATTGCSGSFTNTIVVYDKPTIHPAFTDTLICSIDSLPLRVIISNGTPHWSPNYMITNTNQLQPVVFPKDTTEYKLVVADKGCVDSIKIKVNVLDYIEVDIRTDTGICRTDNLVLRPVSHALSYWWRESSGTNTLNNSNVKYPVAVPLATTTYFVTANLGYCEDSAAITVNVSPYPVAKLGNDDVVCFGHRVQLSAGFEGAYFTWSPTASLTRYNTLQPLAAPSRNTDYIFTARDTMYCPKEVSDTIHIRVIPAFNVFAGRDTTTGINVPLQLIATGADPSYQYTWTPALYLNNSSITNPVATVSDATYDVMVYTVKATSPEGCSATDDIKVQVYSKGPEIYVPSGFTPNGDGKNDILQPVLVGISKLTAFTIYNRWGQVLFTTTQPGKGWDGTYKSVKQAPGTYVFIAQGQDYTGKGITRKGTVVLIM